MNKNFSLERNTNNCDVYNQENIPVLRFPEFSDEWETIQIKDKFDFFSTNSLSRANLNEDEGVIKNIHYGDIHTKFSTIVNIQEEAIPFISESVPDNKIEKYELCKDGDLLIADASEDYKDIGKTIELTNIQSTKVVGGLHTLLLRDKTHNNALGFNGYLFQTENLKHDIKIIANGISVLGISKKQLEKLNVKIPQKQEQQKIGKFLSAIDKKIDLMEKKYLLYENVKKYYIKKFFSNCDCYEIVKLDDLFNSIKGKGLSKDNIEVDGKYSCILYGELYTTYSQVIEDVESKTSIQEGILSHENDILMPCSTTTTGKDLATASVLLKKDVLLGGDITVLRKKEDNLKEIFFAYYLSYGLTRKIRLLAQGTTIIHIYWNHIKNISVGLPPIEKQENISFFLLFMDKKLSIISKKVNLLRQFKRGLLQKMFI